MHLELNQDRERPSAVSKLAQLIRNRKQTNKSNKTILKSQKLAKNHKHKVIREGLKPTSKQEGKEPFIIGQI